VAGRLRTRVARALAPQLHERGFEPGKSPYFVRPKGRWLEVVWADALEYSKSTFTVTYGIHVPHIAQALGPLGLPESTAPSISRRLGEQRFYTASPSEEMEAVMPAVIADFDSEAVPWFASFPDLAQVADYFRGHELGTGDFNDRGIVVYALLLEATDRVREAAEWFQRAAAQLSRPVYAKGQRFFREPVDGGVKVQRSPFDEKLLGFVKSRVAEVNDDA
jgi:hypothetical protein